jgi:hypothetical protein
LKPLIAILSEADQAKNLSEQLALIELQLTAAELNPDPGNFVQTIFSLNLIAGIASHNRTWHTTTADLAGFFTETAV